MRERAAQRFVDPQRRVVRIARVLIGLEVLWVLRVGDCLHECAERAGAEACARCRLCLQLLLLLCLLLCLLLLLVLRLLCLLLVLGCPYCGGQDQSGGLCCGVIAWTGSGREEKGTERHGAQLGSCCMQEDRGCHLGH
jgi:hypothetical protein